MKKPPRDFRLRAAEQFSKLYNRARPQGKKIDTKKKPIEPDRGKRP